jgi:hypothetical protein
LNKQLYSFSLPDYAEDETALWTQALFPTYILVKTRTQSSLLGRNGRAHDPATADKGEDIEVLAPVWGSTHFALTLS